jgi:hypothetical protein
MDQGEEKRRIPRLLLFLIFEKARLGQTDRNPGPTHWHDTHWALVHGRAYDVSSRYDTSVSTPRSLVDWPGLIDSHGFSVISSTPLPRSARMGVPNGTHQRHFLPWFRSVLVPFGTVPLPRRRQLLQCRATIWKGRFAVAKRFGNLAEGNPLFPAQQEQASDLELQRSSSVMAQPRLVRFRVGVAGSWSNRP